MFFALASSGCSPEKKDPGPRTYLERRNNAVVQHVNERRDPETGDVTTEAPPEPKPVATRRLNLGETRVDRRVEDSRAIPLASRVEVETWADETIRGVLVDESADAYLIDATADEAAPKRSIRRVPRAAVMSIRALPREPQADAR